MSESEEGSEEYEDLLPCEVYKRYFCVLSCSLLINVMLIHPFRLKIAWLNEKMAPDLLENDEDVTENALELIKAMERNLQQNRDPSSKIRHSLHSLGTVTGFFRLGLKSLYNQIKDVDRVRFVLTSYMRERIMKIEQRPAYIIHRWPKNFASN